MDEARIEKQLEEIDRKLVLLTEQMEVARRQQRELRELKDDLSRIGVDVFQALTSELEQVAPHFETQDLLHLLKKLLRNTRNLSLMLDRLESFSNFLDDAAPLQKAAFHQLLSNLEELDRRGYFAFAAEAQKIVERIVTEFSEEDVRQLGENIVTILTTVRNFTQPEILSALNTALAVYHHLDVDKVEDDVSYFKLLREARSPEVRRGLAVGLQFLKNVSRVGPQETDVPPAVPAARG